MELLSRTEAQILADAREVLQNIETRARNEVAGLDGNPGRLSAKAESAEHAIFDVLNCAANWLDNEIAREFVHAAAA